MGRIWKDWVADPVDAATVAEHRYRWDGTIGPDGSQVGDVALAPSISEAKKHFAYRKDEVVMLENGDGAVRARVVLTFCDYDHYGARWEAYRVVRETKKGLWSKAWEVVYPGHIQRGYAKAGLAPDLVDK